MARQVSFHRYKTVLPHVLCLSALFCLLSTGSVSAQTSKSSTAPAPLITQAVDDTRLVELKGNVHPAVRTATDLGPASDSLMLHRMMLVLKRSPAQQAALNKLADSQKNLNSPQYHKWLTPAQFGAQFGAASQDISTITGWLQSHGFSVESVASAKNVIIFSGTNAQLESAFHTTMHQYRSAPPKTAQTASSAAVPPVNLLHYANSTNPSIPEALAPAIMGIVSLNSFPVEPQHVVAGVVRPQPGSNKWKMMQAIHPAPQFTTPINGENFYAVSPSDFATIYNVQPLWNAGIDGTGQTIAISQESNINPADVDSFRSFFGLPPKHLNIINNGPDPGLVTTDNIETEADLDVEWSGAVAKNATVDLVVSGSTETTNGVDLSSQYIIDNNLAPIMSISFGACELALGTSGNQFYNEIWEQAASQGITVLVAAGDSGSASCDQDNPLGAAQDGLTVSGEASTPFNTAVGGTDLYGTFLSSSTYWSNTNSPTTQQSALGYIPELPWNNSCGNPQFLAAVQAGGLQDATEEAFCNDPSEEGLGVVGGSGGPSNCTVSDSTGNCISGYPKPSFQTGVPGIPNDSARDLPDVSLFAGNGLWGSFYVFCESDATPDGTCGFTTSDVEDLAAGGTSFAAPAFAGIMAMVEQKTSSIQGNVNYDLYKLAAAQFTAGTSCDSSTVTNGSSCVFYDIASNSGFPGSNAEPCLGGTLNCNPTNPNDEFGVLPGWNSTPGYDTATGLGTLNAFNLVNTWSTASANLAATTTTLALESANIPYGSPAGGTITVADSNSSGSGVTIPDGDASLVNASGSTPALGIGPFTLNSEGSATVSVGTLTPGTYSVIAHYAGDGTFAASNSTATSLVITQAATTAATTASRTTLSTGQSVTFSTIIEDTSKGLNPTGMVTFTNMATGATLGTSAAQAAIDGNGNSIAAATLNVAARSLSQGSNNITATYSGDSNYTASTAAAVSVTYTGPFSLTSASASVTIASGSSATTALTLTANGAPLPAAVSFSCPAAPAGITCSFSPAIIAAGATSGQSTLTINGTFPTSNVRHATVAHNIHTGLMTATGGIAMSAMLLMFAAPRKRRRYGCLLLCATALISMVPLGCSGKSGGGSSGTNTLTSTSTSVTATPASGVQGSNFTFTATVSGMSGTGTPTGTVTFSDASSTLGTGTVSNGMASFSSTTLALGSHSVVATYSGDTNFAPSNSGTPATADVQYSVNLPVVAMDSLGNTTTIQIPVIVQ
jgi:Pro-kumamolisin, activation domain/Bacterial Ig-like domain (group 3)